MPSTSNLEGIDKVSSGQVAKQLKINPSYLSADFADYVRTGIQGGNDSSIPFPHFQLQDFIEDASLLKQLRSEVNNVKYDRRDNDLYSMFQTADLSTFSNEENPYLCGFRQFMDTTVRDFFTTITDFELNDEISITGSMYLQGDVLLPHDDGLDGRKIAFILYLTPEWDHDFGGQLALYDTHLAAANRPSSISKKLMPLFNSLVFFPVAINTWHMVEEVTAIDFARVSLNGWFYSDDAISATPSLREPTIIRRQLTPSTSMSDLESWIESRYVNPNNFNKLKRRFTVNAEMYMENFLKTEVYQAVFDELREATFTPTGPPDIRYVNALEWSSVKPDSLLESFLTLFQSESMGYLMSEWTGLQLFKSCRSDALSSPRVKKKRNTDWLGLESFPASRKHLSLSTEKKSAEVVMNVYRFEHGCYTLADQQLADDNNPNNFCVDLKLFFVDLAKWPEDVGGFISYVGFERNSEMLRILPHSNCLSIALHEPQIMTFTKYLNCLVESEVYYVVTCSFFDIFEEEEAESSSSNVCPVHGRKKTQRKQGGKIFVTMRSLNLALTRRKIDTFNMLFMSLLKKHVFDGFIEKLEECRRLEESNKRPILLKLCGSLTDVRLLIEIACQNLGLHWVFVEERLDPLNLLSEASSSEKLHLIHIQDNVSLNYLNRLLETFYSSEQSAFAIVTVRSNDSHIIRLDPNLSVLVPIESFVFDDPQPLFNRIMKELIPQYTYETEFFLSGPLLKQLRNSFMLEEQSFAKLQNIIGMSTAKFGMHADLTSKGVPKTNILPEFEQYWMVLELFCSFINKANASNSMHSIVDTHIAIQLDENWYKQEFEKAKSFWRNVKKEVWIQFIEDCIRHTASVENECRCLKKLKELELCLTETKDLIARTELMTSEEIMRKNNKISPSRRKPIDNSHETNKVFASLSKIFCNLGTIKVNSVLPSQPIQITHNDSMKNDLPDFVKKSPFF